MDPRGSALLLLAVIACDDIDEPARDSEGCWTDGWAAVEAFDRGACEAKEACSGEDEAPLDECMAERDEQRETEHSGWCFDGCFVDQCLRDLEAAADSCDFTPLDDSCYEAFSTGEDGEECVKAW